MYIYIYIYFVIVIMVKVFMNSEIEDGEFEQVCASDNVALELYKEQTYSKCSWFSYEGWEGWARVVDVHDGDTITTVFTLDDGKSFFKHRLRLDGIDTYEMTSKNEDLKQKAVRGRNRLIQLITMSDSGVDVTREYTRKEILALFNGNDVHLVWIKCGPFDKYGRILCKVFKNNVDAENGNDMASVLLRENLAYQYSGGHKPSFE